MEDREEGFYEVEVEFVFKGTFTIKAEGKDAAMEKVQEHCGFVNGPQSTLPEEDTDWEFPIHPDKRILGVKKLEEKPW